MRRSKHIWEDLYEYTAIISDLGESYDVTETREPKQIYYGNQNYWAPEVVGKKIYSKASDIYAFGCLIKEIINKKLHTSQNDGRNCAVEVPNILIRSALLCLVSDAEKRPSAKLLSFQLSEIVRKIYETTQYGEYDFGEDVTQLSEGNWQDADSWALPLSLTEYNSDGSSAIIEYTLFRDVDINELLSNLSIENSDAFDEFGIPF